MSRLYMFCTIIMLASCEQKKTDYKIIPAPEMTRVLWDIMQVDEYATYKIASDSTKNLKNERIRLYQQVFDMHRVSHDDFNESFKFYSGKPDQLKILFDSLSIRGERERKKLYSANDSSKAKGKDTSKINVKDTLKAKLKDTLKSAARDTSKIAKKDTLKIIPKGRLKFRPRLKKV